MIGFIIGAGAVCLAGMYLFIFALMSAASNADDALFVGTHPLADEPQGELGEDQYKIN